jgi:hypothetical protein
MAFGTWMGILLLEVNRVMRTFLVFFSALALLPALAPAGPGYAGRLPLHNHRVHFANGMRSSRLAHRGYYYFNGLNWAFVPLVIPYGGLALSSDFVYQGVDISDDIYPYAQPTSDPNIVISPFAPNALIAVGGIPPGAKVRDPVSEQIFLRP